MDACDLREQLLSYLPDQRYRICWANTAYVSSTPGASVFLLSFGRFSGVVAKFGWAGWKCSRQELLGFFIALPLLETGTSSHTRSSNMISVLFNRLASFFTYESAAGACSSFCAHRPGYISCFSIVPLRLIYLYSGYEHRQNKKRKELGATGPPRAPFAHLCHNSSLEDYFTNRDGSGHCALIVSLTRYTRLVLKVYNSHQGFVAFYAPDISKSSQCRWGAEYITSESSARCGPTLCGTLRGA